MSTWRVVALLVVCVFGNADFGFSAETAAWQTEWRETIEAAKREGQVSLYGGREIVHPDIIAAFSKEFPFIKVLSATGRAADLMTRIVAERRADKYLADVMASGPNGLAECHEQERGRSVGLHAH
jgi:hypothetical protein